MIFRDAGIGNRGGVAIYFSRVDQFKRLTPLSILTEGCKFSLEGEGVICQQEKVFLCGVVSINKVKRLFQLGFPDLDHTDSKRQK